MTKNDKLEALRKAREAAEHEALREEQHIQQILEERRAAMEEVVTQIHDLRKKLTELASRERYQALLGGLAGKATGIQIYEDRLIGEMNALGKVLTEKKEEFLRAQTRAQTASEEVVEARVERKKVEKLAENKKLREKILEAAREEGQIDERTLRPKRQE